MLSIDQYAGVAFLIVTKAIHQAERLLQHAAKEMVQEVCMPLYTVMKPIPRCWHGLHPMGKWLAITTMEVCGY